MEQKKVKKKKYPTYFMRDNREQLEHILSSFRWHVENMKMEGTKEEFLKWFMDQEIMTEQVYAEMWLEEETAHRRNINILKVIRKVKGVSFCRHLRAFLKECEAKFSVRFTITREAGGDWVAEKWGKEIQGYWVDQRCTNMEGDSFEGYIWVKLREDRFLRFFYTC